MFSERGSRGELCTLRLLAEPNVNTNGRSSVGEERNDLLGACLFQFFPRALDSLCLYSLKKWVTQGSLQYKKVLVLPRVLNEESQR